MRNKVFKKWKWVNVGSCIAVWFCSWEN